MTDGKNWLDPENETLGAAVLSAARQERSSGDALTRTLLAVSGGSALAALTSEAAAGTLDAGAAGSAEAAAGAVGAGSTAAGSMVAGVEPTAVGAGLKAGAAGAGALGGAGAGVVAKSGGIGLIAQWVGGVVVGVVAVGIVQTEPEWLGFGNPGNEAVETVDDGIVDDGRVPAPRLVGDPDLPATEAARAEPQVNLDEAVLAEEPAVEPLKPRATERSLGARASASADKVQPEAANHTVANATQAAVAEAPEELTSELREELGLIDRARAALRAGNGAEALTTLVEHRRRFARGRLVPEALFLRMQAYHQQGNLSGAQQVARQILERYSTGPHAGRARELLHNSGKNKDGNEK